MRLRVKRGTTAVIASDERGSASFEPRSSLAMNAVAPRLTAVGPRVDRVCAIFDRGYNHVCFSVTRVYVLYYLAAQNAQSSGSKVKPRLL